MLKKEVKFKDFDGNIQTTVVYFNLADSEIVRLDTQFPGGLEAHINDITARKDTLAILDLFEEVVLSSYGVKSPDGIYFDKSKELSARFKNSAIYNALFSDILKDTETATDFFNQLLASNQVTVQT